MFLFSLRCHDAKKDLVVRRDIFGVILNLLPHIEFLMYVKTILLMFGSNNVYGIIFYQVYLLPWLTIPLFVLWNSGDVLFGF